MAIQIRVASNLLGGIETDDWVDAILFTRTEAERTLRKCGPDRLRPASLQWPVLAQATARLARPESKDKRL